MAPHLPPLFIPMASALSCGCSPSAPPEEFDDYQTKYTSSTDDGSELSDDSGNSAVLNTPYSRVTPLFRNIEKENWEGVLHFLTTGKWSSAMFASFNEHMKSPAPGLQAKTWVTAYDSSKKPEWSQLPLHAAISYAAPHVVIQKLVELYPKAVRCTDNEGMLPIHLAFGFGSTDKVLSLLLESFPSAVNERGIGRRYPYECCELGPNKSRGKVYRLVSEQVANRVTAEIDKDWREFTVAAQESVAMPSQVDLEDKTLHEFILELLKDRKELIELKKNRAAKPKLSITPLPSAEPVTRAPRSINIPASLSTKSPKTPKTPKSPRKRWGRK